MDWQLTISIIAGWIALAIVVGVLVGAAADMMGEVDE